MVYSGNMELDQSTGLHRFSLRIHEFSIPPQFKNCLGHRSDFRCRDAMDRDRGVYRRLIWFENSFAREKKKRLKRTIALSIHGVPCSTRDTFDSKGEKK